MISFSGTNLRSWKGWLSWALAFFCISVIICSLIGLIPGQPALSTFALSTFILGLLGWVPIAAVAHESCHLIIGSILGFKMRYLSIGTGEVFIKFEAAKDGLILRESPFFGNLHDLFLVESHEPYRWRRILMIAAGPAGNAAIALTSFVYLYHSGNKVGLFTDMVVFQILVANAYLFFLSVVEFQRKNGLGSDGLLIDLLLHERRLIPRHRFESGDAKGASGRWSVQNLPAKTVLTRLKNALDAPAQDDKTRAMQLDEFVTAVLMFGHPDFLMESDRYSKELLALKPDEWTVKGTRGSVLITMGEIDAGKTMLAEVIRNSPSVDDRAISAAFLGLAEWRLGNKSAALEWLGKSRDLDPDCGATLRVESIIHKAGPAVIA